MTLNENAPLKKYDTIPNVKAPLDDEEHDHGKDISSAISRSPWSLVALAFLVFCAFCAGAAYTTGSSSSKSLRTPLDTSLYLEDPLGGGCIPGYPIEVGDEWIERASQTLSIKNCNGVYEKINSIGDWQSVCVTPDSNGWFSWKSGANKNDARPYSNAIYNIIYAKHTPEDGRKIQFQAYYRCADYVKTNSACIHGHNIETYSVSTQDICEKMCTSNSKCKSYEYRPPLTSSYNCALNDVDHTSPDFDDNGCRGQAYDLFEKK